MKSTNIKEHMISCFKGISQDRMEWIEGFLSSDSDGNYFITTIEEYFSEKSDSSKVKYVIEPDTICQNTGCIDSMLCSIFEHDIVVIEGKRYCVKWESIHSQWCLFDESGFWGLLKDWYSQAYVIGNTVEELVYQSQEAV